MADEPQKSPSMLQRATISIAHLAITVCRSSPSFLPASSAFADRLCASRAARAWEPRAGSTGAPGSSACSRSSEANAPTAPLRRSRRSSASSAMEGAGVRSASARATESARAGRRRHATRPGEAEPAVGMTSAGPSEARRGSRASCSKVPQISSMAARAQA